MLLCFVCFTSTACADNTLLIKPEMIDVYNNDKIIAIDDAGNYQIGNAPSNWSKVYDIQEKGFSTLEFMVTTDTGMFLIGTESHPDLEDRTANGVYYTGLIALVDSNNKTIREWRTNTDFLHVNAFHNQLTLTSFDGIFTLTANSDIEQIDNNDKRHWLTSIRNHQGELIVCNSLIEAKAALSTTGSAGCSNAKNWSFDAPWHSSNSSSTTSKNDWSFSGKWYPSDETTITAPIICGSWLIESVQDQYDSPLTGIIVREITSGSLIKEKSMPDFQLFFCINDSEVMTNTSLRSYALPDVTQANTYSCHENEMVVSIKKSSDQSICLTTSGHIGKLKINN